MAKDPTTEDLLSDVQSRLRPALVGCSVAVVAILLGLAVVLFLFGRSPHIRNLGECKMRLQRVGDALDRFATLNDKYPDKLNELVPDYLPASALHCPLQKKDEEPEEFAYTKQHINAPDNAVLLTCENHRLKSKMPGVVLYYLKNGSVIWVSSKDVPSTSNGTKK